LLRRVKTIQPGHTQTHGDELKPQLADHLQRLVSVYRNTCEVECCMNKQESAGFIYQSQIIIHDHRSIARIPGFRGRLPSDAADDVQSRPERGCSAAFSMFTRRKPLR